MPTLKGYDCYLDGYQEPHVAVARSASKARYVAYLALSDYCPDLRITEIKVRRNPGADMSFPDVPDVNEHLDDRDRETILNAFGGGRHIAPHEWGYRDYQCLSPKDERINRLSALGLFQGPCGVDANGDTPGWCGAFWYLTDDGKALARALIGQREAA
jgi:hypothetical protein